MLRLIWMWGGLAINPWLFSSTLVSRNGWQSTGIKYVVQEISKQSYRINDGGVACVGQSRMGDAE